MLFSSECLPHLLICLLVALVGHMVHDVAAADFKLMILHNGDMQANFDPVNERGKKCTVGKDKACYGGFARVAHVVKEAKQKAADDKGPPVVFLNAGDTFQGTIYFTVHKWEMVANITSMMQLDAMAPGVHEFDDGVDGLVPFINAVPYQVLGSNLDLSAEPRLKATKLTGSWVTTLNGQKIGIIGYVTNNAKAMSVTEKIQFMDIVQSVQKEATKLTKDGVKILIAVGSGGFEVDVQIAKEVPEIDVVCGGNTNTFLYTGVPPVEYPVKEGEYPHKITQAGGKMVPVVHAWSFTNFLGKLIVTFDESGEVKSAFGNPIHLDHKIQHDKDVLEALKPWREYLEKHKKMAIGTTRTLINAEGRLCRYLECTMGNVINDAAIDYYQKHYPKPERGWSDVSISLINSGSMTNHMTNLLNNATRKMGQITIFDIYNTVPYTNMIIKVKLKGSVLKETMEHSVSLYPKNPDDKEKWGGFLQVSGLRVKYDMCLPVGQQVTSLFARCNTCDEPIYKLVDPTEEYGIITTKYLADGKDGYSMIQEQMIDPLLLPVSNQEIMRYYINNTSPVWAGLEGRIIVTKVCKKKTIGSGAGCCTSNFLVKFSAIILLAMANVFLLNGW